MPNREGSFWILVSWLPIFALIFACCSSEGCMLNASSTITRHTPRGDMTATHHRTLFSDEYVEDFDSDHDYERCLEVQTALMPLYRAGRVLNWAEMTSIQQSCFTQTAGWCMPDWRIDGSPSDITFGAASAQCAAISGGMGGTAPYSSFGYAWTMMPRQSLNPYVRTP